MLASTTFSAPGNPESTTHTMCCPSFLVACAPDSCIVGRYGCAPDTMRWPLRRTLTMLPDTDAQTNPIQRHGLPRIHRAYNVLPTLGVAPNSDNVSRRGCAPESHGRTTELLMLAMCRLTTIVPAPSYPFYSSQSVRQIHTLLADTVPKQVPSACRATLDPQCIQ